MTSSVLAVGEIARRGDGGRDDHFESHAENNRTERATPVQEAWMCEQARVIFRKLFDADGCLMAGDGEERCTPTLASLKSPPLPRGIHYCHKELEVLFTFSC